MRHQIIPGQSAGLPSSTEGAPSGLEAFGDIPPADPGRHALRNALTALRRFRWMIIGLAALGLGGGLIATRFIRPDYEVAATIWIETPNKGKAGTPIQGEELLDSKAWVELLTTFKVLDPVVQGRRLYLSYGETADSTLFQAFDLGDRFLPGEYGLEVDKDGKTYQLKQRNGLYTETGALGDSVGRKVGFRWMPRVGKKDWGRKIGFEVVTPREASVQLTKRLQSTLREDNFLVLRLTDKAPDAAALTLNSLIRRFVDEAAEQKRSKLTLLAQILDSQVVDQDRRLKDAEERLESFRVGTVTLPREDTPIAAGLQLTQPTVYTSYFAQRSALDSLRRDRHDIEEVLKRSSAGGVAVDAFNTIVSVRQAPDLQRVLGELSTTEAQLRDSLGRYTEEYKGVRNLREKIQLLRTQTIPLYANALIRQIQNREGELEGRIGTASHELQSIPVRSQTEARLRREVEQADLLYRSLESSRQQARLAEASAVPDVRILDSAQAPSHPSKNSAPTLILLGLLIGLGLGIGVALLIDRFDPRFRYPEQVSSGLGLPILGTVPEIKRAKGREATPDEASQVIEAFRSIRMSLSHSFDPEGPIALAISSPSPGDGKSLVAANLALTFAEGGYRTILVDGDIRRGGLHRTFSIERRPGLVDHLAGEAPLSSVLRASTHANLTVIPCGSRRHLGPELLGSAAMKALMARLRKEYQVIVVDTPPLGAGIDPFVISTMTGNLALVLRAGETDRQFAEAKLQVLDRLPVRLLGAILNDVRLSEGAYKYYRYSYGYVADPEEDQEPVQLPTTPAAT